MAMNASSHIPFEILADIAENRVTGNELAAALAHVSSCSECDDVLRQLQHLIVMMRTDRTEEVPADLLRRDLWVADIVYFPLETELLRQARTRGCRTMSGGGMAVFQAVGAFQLFTGLEPDAFRMLRHFNEM